MPSADGSSLDEEARKQPATKEMAKAAEEPLKGAGCMPSKDNLAQSQKMFKSPFSRKDVQTQRAAEVGASPEGPGPPRGFNVI